MAKNDLNMMLKSQVVKLRAELDITKSLPTIKRQITQISKRLDKNPIKLKVRLDAKVGELNRQMREITKMMSTSKTLKPLRIPVRIDVAGSATAIKGQLEAVYQTVSNFNSKYAQQIKKMNQTTSMAGAGVNPTGGINVQAYARQVEEVKRLMRNMHGKGLFTSLETKNAQGELTGFTAQLEKTNGVVQKIRYEWDAKAKAFTPINQQTINSIEKHVNQASRTLRGLYVDIDKLEKGKAQSNLFSRYTALEGKVGKGTLLKEDVQQLKEMVVQERHLQGEVKKTNDLERQRKVLLHEIRQQSYGIANASERNKYAPLLAKARKAELGDIKEIRLETKMLTDHIKRQDEARKRGQQVLKERNRLEKEFIKLQRTTPSKAVSIQYMEDTRNAIKSARGVDDIRKAQQRLNSIKKSGDSNRYYHEMRTAIHKTKEKLEELKRSSQITQASYSRHMKMMKDSTRQNITDINRQFDSLVRTQNSNIARNQERMQRVIVDGNTTNAGNQNYLKNLRSAISAGDADAVQRYVQQLYKGRIETIQFSEANTKAHGAVDRLKVTMANTGNTVKKTTLDISRANNTIRQTGSGIDLNMNRSLGVFEQLKVAMKRVPVWMGAMTLFYGTIRSVRAMVREITEIDKALTEIRRVASDDISIENIFKGGVEMSAKLGNNIHDVMETLGDFSRTFGEFNERQLLAITNTAVLMSNVSELSAQEAGNTLIATMNAFNIEAEESIRIVDAFNEVDNNFAVNETCRAS